jgi:hypothetical protein
MGAADAQPHGRARSSRLRLAGEQRKARSLLEANPFDAAWADLYARQAAVDLAQFYIGFAVLVEQALGGQSKDELRGWDSNPQPTG